MTDTEIDQVEARVHTMPPCDFAQTESACDLGQDRYDFKTKYGPWANACTSHWTIHRMHNELGTGKGQKLVRA